MNLILYLREAYEKFVWYNPFQVTGDPKPEKPPPRTTTIPSSLSGAGYSLFVEKKFYVGEVVSFYLENVFIENTKSVYKLECELPESKEKVALDVEGSGFPGNKFMYLGAHMVNDPQLIANEDDKDPNRFNVTIRNDIVLVAENEVDIMDELYTHYHLN